MNQHVMKKLKAEKLFGISEAFQMFAEDYSREPSSLSELVRWLVSTHPDRRGLIGAVARAARKHEGLRR